jgi:hypothetical protein
LIHTLENSAYNIPFVNECNGIILEKDTFKIVCYTFNKCYDTPTISDNLDKNNLYVEKSIEGTLIRIFYYNNDWIVSTKKCINASKSKWLSDKSFLELFEDCVSKYNFMEKLNKSYCYSFIIMHPENNIVVNYTKPDICHISTRDLNTMDEIEISIDIPKNERIHVDDLKYQQIMLSLSIDNSTSYEGYIFIDIK